ncbi:hypothetical protein [Aliikangiella sp. IMCC44359]|uniref:hypothetical protein n=1 Tax=Aliikangiella sp. IMCC44359 TaxID=3459125 RepID=UPI00403A9E10
MKLKILLILTTLFCLPAKADWHSGKISSVSTSYEGDKVTLVLEDWSRNNCTCYPTWPNNMCLDSARETANFERSFILSAKARNKVVVVHIDETTCKVIAIAEYGVN